MGLPWGSAEPQGQGQSPSSAAVGGIRLEPQARSDVDTQDNGNTGDAWNTIARGLFFSPTSLTLCYTLHPSSSDKARATRVARNCWDHWGRPKKHATSPRPRPSRGLATAGPTTLCLLNGIQVRLFMETLRVSDIRPCAILNIRTAPTKHEQPERLATAGVPGDDQQKRAMSPKPRPA